MQTNQLKSLLTNAIDTARSDLWETNAIISSREPTDRFKMVHDRQSARAEIWDAIIKYREEVLNFDELLMFLQSFDRKVTPAGLIDLLGDKYHG